MSMFDAAVLVRHRSDQILIPGQHLVQDGVYLFACPICRKTFRFDDPYGPVCTGPSEMRDEHAPVAMKLVDHVSPKVYR